MSHALVKKTARCPHGMDHNWGLFVWHFSVDHSRRVDCNVKHSDRVNKEEIDAWESANYFLFFFWKWLHLIVCQPRIHRRFHQHYEASPETTGVFNRGWTQRRAQEMPSARTLPAVQLFKIESYLLVSSFYQLYIFCEFFDTIFVIPVEFVYFLLISLLILQRQLLSLCLFLPSDSTGLCQRRNLKLKPWVHIYNCLVYYQSMRRQALLL